MSESVAVGIVRLLCDAVGAHGVDPQASLRVARFDGATLRDPNALLPLDGFEALVRDLLARTGDPALGLRIASTIDLRTQGFWGYSLLSSQTLRERVQMHARYQPLRFPSDLSLRVEEDVAVVTCSPRGVSPDLVPFLMDWAIATSCLQHRRLIPTSTIALSLSYPEQPHHRALRVLAAGPVCFDAAGNSLRFPASQLDVPISSADPHLAELARQQLDRQLELLGRERAVVPIQSDPLRDVRELLGRGLMSMSLARAAADLKVSARTLQRRLGAHGVSFQQLQEEVRRSRATRLLLETDAPIDDIALQLGYGEAASFRRAFRRWTNLSPSSFRASARHARTSSPRLASDDRS